jgi:hypothetical protein
MKKTYISPEVKVYKMQMQGTLAYSGGSLGAREFDFDDDFDFEE